MIEPFAARIPCGIHAARYSTKITCRLRVANVRGKNLSIKRERHVSKRRTPVDKPRVDVLK